MPSSSDTEDPTLEFLVDDEPQQAFARAGSNFIINDISNKSKEPPLWQKFTAVLGAGLCFGVILGKSGVSIPGFVHAQFLFIRWMMMKVLFMGAASSTLAFLSYNYFRPAKFNQIRSFMWAGGRGWPAIVVGSSILGVAMGLCGGCAGTFYSAFGLGIPLVPGLVILAGLTVGSLTFPLMEPKLRPFLLAYPIQEKHSTVDKFLGVEYWKVALPMALAFIACEVLLESLIPWRTELTPNQLFYIEQESQPIKWVVWPPYICGMFAAPAQLLLLVSSNKVSSCATSFMLLVSQSLRPFSSRIDKTDFAYWKFILSISNSWEGWWTVVYMLGIFMLPMLAALITQPDPVLFSYGFKAFPLWMSFVGAMVSVWGARIGVGCSGFNALSGMPLLSTASILSVCGFFIGGLPTAWLMHASGFDSEYYLS